MTRAVNLLDISAQVELPAGDRIVLLDLLGKGDQHSKEEMARNIFRLDSRGQVKWQVHSQFDSDGDPFTHLHLKNGLTAYRWDGGTYEIDLDTGAATPLALER